MIRIDDLKADAGWLKLSYGDLSADTGIPATAIAKMMTGRNRMTAENAGKLHRAIAARKAARQAASTMSFTKVPVTAPADEDARELAAVPLSIQDVATVLREEMPDAQVELSGAERITLGPGGRPQRRAMCVARVASVGWTVSVNADNWRAVLAQVQRSYSERACVG